MSGSDRTITAQRTSPRVTRVNAGAGEKIDAPRGCGSAPEAQTREPREIKITRALAVEALGGEDVRFAERLRAKGWSVRGISRHLAADEAIIRALFGEGGPL